MKFLWSFLSFFCFLFIFTFEFEYSILPQIYPLIHPFLERLVQFSGSVFFGFTNPFNPQISSDSLGMYIHVFNLFWISLFLSIMTVLLCRINHVNLRLYTTKIITYYLSLQLLIYGFDKLFKAQFFYPEPNILHTNLKDLSPDILYWSTMGFSRVYSIFLGGSELLVALLLWFPKTRLLGLLIGTGIMINVFAVNVGFDISVKLYSLFLLGCFALLLSPFFSYLFSVFSLNAPSHIPVVSSPKLSFFSSHSKLIKWVVICLIISEGLYPYFVSGNWNDDSVKRPKFHGAYSISPNEFGIEKMYVHRAGYLIFENEKQVKEDFQMELDSSAHQIILWDYKIKKAVGWKYKAQGNEIIELSLLADSSKKINCTMIN